MSQENVEVVRRALEAFREGRVDEALGLLALMADWTEGFEEWSYRAESGDHVVVRLHQWGRGAGSGAPVAGDYWMTYLFEDGLVTRFSVFSDREQAFASLPP
jgi:hypothetical protein